jgi:DNA-directed RNA polymerase subunit RPC12/RpoP
MPLTWHNVGDAPPRSYVCGYCGHTVGPNKGWQTTDHYTINNRAVPEGHVYICSFCGKPTYFDRPGWQHPGAPFGNDVDSLPKDVAALYGEARDCMPVKSFTSAVLTCRKLLMHLAVEKGAPTGKSFQDYVEYLSLKGYVPPDGKGWVDHIRKKGNEANHEIKIMAEADAKDLILFSEMLLKFVYEFPAKVPPPPAAAMVASSAPIKPAPAKP